jgi:hypothetical protein
MNDFGGCLELDRIDEKEDLILLFCSWQGESVFVKKCPGFNDIILEMMRIQEDGDCNMHHLEIVDCPNISVATLKRLVNTLYRSSAEPRLEAVRVYGLVPHFSQEDPLCTWFETNIEYFDNWWCP